MIREWIELRTQLERDHKRWLRISRNSEGAERDISTAVASTCGNVLARMENLEASNRLDPNG